MAQSQWVSNMKTLQSFDWSERITAITLRLGHSEQTCRFKWCSIDFLFIHLMCVFFFCVKWGGATAFTSISIKTFSFQAEKGEIFFKT